MTAPGPAWSAQEEELLLSLAAAGESAAAISTLLKRSPHAVRTRAKVLKINLARSLARAEDEGKISVPTTNRQIQRLILPAQRLSD